MLRQRQRLCEVDHPDACAFSVVDEEERRADDLMGREERRGLQSGADRLQALQVLGNGVRVAVDEAPQGFYYLGREKKGLVSWVCLVLIIVRLYYSEYYLNLR